MKRRFGLDRLLQLCEAIAPMLHAMKVGRVIARPFDGQPGQFRRTANRHDYAIAPPGADLAATGCTRPGGRPMPSARSATSFRCRGSDAAQGEIGCRAFRTASGAGRRRPSRFLDLCQLRGVRQPLWPSPRRGRTMPAHSNGSDARIAAAFLARTRGPAISRCSPPIMATIRPGAGTDHTRERVPVSDGGCRRGGAWARSRFADVGATVAHLARRARARARGGAGCDPRSAQGRTAPASGRRCPAVFHPRGWHGEAHRSICRVSSRRTEPTPSPISGHFLKVYEAATGVLKTPEDYQRLTLAVLEESAGTGVVYSETFLSPDFCGGRELGAWREYLHAIREAADQAERKMGITLRGIVTCIRHFGPDKARRDRTLRGRDGGRLDRRVRHRGGREGRASAGLCLAFRSGTRGGPAADGPCRRVGRTAKRPRYAARICEPERIGHGVRAIEDLALVDELAERGIVLEVCPGSNIALGHLSRMAAPPDRRAVRAGREGHGLDR